MTDGRTDGRTDGGDCNIPNAFLKKRGDNYSLKVRKVAKKSDYSLFINFFFNSLKKIGLSIIFMP